MSVEIHTVTFGGDVRLLELQALSIDRYLEHDKISKYRIIVNDKNEQDLTKHIENFLKDHISFSLRKKVEIESASRYIKIGDDGWKDQQYLKLYSVQNSNSEWVIVLDSKNHFIKETTIGDFFDGEKAKTYFVNPSKEQIPWLNKSLAFFCVDGHSGTAMPTVTPYTMKPAVVDRMLNAIRSDYRTSGFENMFSSPALERASEFFLYFAYILKHGSINGLYSSAPRLCETLYTVWPQDRRIVERYLNSLINKEFNVFGLHRKRLPQLNDHEKLLISKIWSPINTPQPHEYYLEYIQ